MPRKQPPPELSDASLYDLKYVTNIAKEETFLEDINREHVVKQFLGKGFPYYGGLDPYFVATMLESVQDKIQLRDYTNCFRSAVDAECRTRADAKIEVAQRAMSQLRVVANAVIRDGTYLDKETEFSDAIVAKWKTAGNVATIGPITSEIPVTAMTNGGYKIDTKPKRIDIRIDLGGPVQAKAFGKNALVQHCIIAELKYMQTEKHLNTSSLIGKQITNYVIKSAKINYGGTTYAPLACMLIYNVRRAGVDVIGTDPNVVHSHW